MGDAAFHSCQDHLEDLDCTNSSCFGRLPDFLKACAHKVFMNPGSVEFHLLKLRFHLSGIERTRKASVRASHDVAIQDDLGMPDLCMSLHIRHSADSILGGELTPFLFC